MAQRVAVMHEGRIVEMGMTEDVMRRPREAYTAELVAAFRTALGASVDDGARIPPSLPL
jgi:ABC-type oligopeptide transport system, ATPase component